MKILAYIDPGLGQLIWLSIVSFFLGFVFWMRKIRGWIVNFFLKIFRRSDKASLPSEMPAVEKAEVKR